MRRGLGLVALLTNRVCEPGVFSPPYDSARTYSISFALRSQAWVDWMRPIVVECCRVSRGLVAINMSGQINDRRYSASPEFLVADLLRLDGLACWPSPYAWVKMEAKKGARPNGIPGSGGKECQRRDWEPVYCFAEPSNLPLPWTDNIAFGLPKGEDSYGGEFSNRGTSGKRANEPGPTRRSSGKMKRVDRDDPFRFQGRVGCAGRKKSGEIKKGNSGTRLGRNNCNGIPGSFKGSILTGPFSKTWQGDANGAIKGSHNRNRPAISNHGNVIRVPVGGGKLGDRQAHESEAPMPLGLAERFVCWFAEPGSTVLDPFTGSGTTGHASLKHGRRFIGCDIRPGKGGVKTARERLTRIGDSRS